MSTNQLVVFDFDLTMTDQDSDRWVFEVLAIDIRRMLETQLPHVQFTDLIAACLRDLHAKGITREQLEDVLRIIPFHPAMERTLNKLKSATDPKTTLLCLSNANSVYIPTILQPKGLLNLFDEIITNPAEWKPSGLLELRRRIDPNGPQHNCRICSPNMCKGDELEGFLKRHGAHFDRMIYVGDGSNDFCPVLRLRSQDLTLCREFSSSSGLARCIASRGKEEGLRCEVVYWREAWELEEYFS